MDSLFEDLISVENATVKNPDLNEFDPLSYLIDIKEYLKKHPVEKLDYDLEDFTKESLAAQPDMDWLNFMDFTLMAPNSENVEEQKRFYTD